MTKLVLDAETIAKIRAAGPDVLIVAEDGTEVGWMCKKDVRTDGLWYTPEERARRMSGTGRPLKEVLDELRAKYGD